MPLKKKKNATHSFLDAGLFIRLFFIVVAFIFIPISFLKWDPVK